MRKIAIRTLLAPSLLSALAGAAASAGCGVDVNPNDCHATNSCGNPDASADGEQSDVMVGDGGEAASEGGPMDGSGDAPNDSGQCGSGMTSCNGTCVNEGNDPNHCGSCTKQCPGPTSGMGSAACDNGVCIVKCSSGYLSCNGTCVSASTGPSGNPCIINESNGIFVSPAGSDSAAGTQVAPVKTIGKAMDLAKAASKSVFACGNNGTYNENLVVGSSRDGVNVYGGLDCTTTPSQWKYVATDLASVSPTTAGYALELQGLTKGATFEDFSFTSVGGANPGDSSIAVFAAGSTNVVFHRTTMTAGTGVAGQDQQQTLPYSNNAPNGADGTAVAGGGLNTNTACSSSYGGAGGQPAGSGNNGGDGAPGPSNMGTVAQCQGNTGGGPGVNGAVGSDGTGANSWATFNATTWSPSAGSAGGPGAVGQGGGGGASVDTSGGGSAGGAGGCGGVGGSAGGGGGSSIAVLAFQSSVDLESCTLNASTPGRGGNGAAGQVGQTGGAHGGINMGSNACTGGKGGNGGNGGGGGGGAGGLSAGVVWLGTAPTINGASVPSASTLANVSTAASGGAAGAGGGASNAGLAGTFSAVVQFQ
jgi:hypothetical protein